MFARNSYWGNYPTTIEIKQIATIHTNNLYSIVFYNKCRFLFPPVGHRGYTRPILWPCQHIQIHKLRETYQKRRRRWYSRTQKSSPTLLYPPSSLTHSHRRSIQLWPQTRRRSRFHSDTPKPHLPLPGRLRGQRFLLLRMHNVLAST